MGKNDKATEPVQPAVEPANQQVPLFGVPSFSKPEREIKTKDGKSRMVAHVEVIVGGVLHVETGIWHREHIDRDKGTVSDEFSVSLPRNVRPIKGDSESAMLVDQWKEATLTAFDAWSEAQTEAQRKASLKAAPRLVKVRPLNPTGPTPAQNIAPNGQPVGSQPATMA